MSSITSTVEQVADRYTSLRVTVSEEGKSQLKAPLKNKGTFDKYQFIVTPAIGRQYGADLQLKDLVSADDASLKDLAQIVSTRGVLYLKNQDINADEAQVFMKRFHEAAGAPKSSGLHIHPSINVQGGNAEGRRYQSISSEAQKKAGGSFWRNDQRRFWASKGWHSDVSFEKAPADYSMLKLVQLPGIGGDTMFASGEALYERLSPSFAGYLETLQAVHAGTQFVEEVQRNGGQLFEGERGSPFNTNKDLTAIHPVIRINPVTGKRSVFVNREFTKSIVGLTPFESDNILNFLFEALIHNHDLQVRVRWEQNDLALWDNRSNYHCASFDFTEPRLGERACAVGEVPFFDPKYPSAAA